MGSKNRNRLKNFLVIGLISTTVLIQGCGGARFSCTENLEGIKCDPPSRVYEQVLNQHSQKISSELSSGEKSTLRDKEQTAIADKLSERLHGKPLRVPPKIIKIWIAPWEDSDGDLHSGEVIYSEIAPVKGRWIIGEKQVGDFDFEIKNANTGFTEAFPERLTTIETGSKDSTQKGADPGRQKSQPQPQNREVGNQPRVKKE